MFIEYRKQCYLILRKNRDIVFFGTGEKKTKTTLNAKLILKSKNSSLNPFTTDNRLQRKISRRCMWYRRNICSWFSSNSEAGASELLVIPCDYEQIIVFVIKICIGFIGLNVWNIVKNLKETCFLCLFIQNYRNNSKNNTSLHYSCLEPPL